MWKFHNFSVTQILREIDFGEYRCSKYAVFAVLGALNKVNLVNLVKNSLRKMQNFIEIKIKTFKCVKMADFDTRL